MAKNERLRGVIKGTLSLISDVCVDAAACGCMAAAVPVALMNPIVGGMIVLGGAISAAAFNDKVVNPFVDNKVDEVSDYIRETARDAKDAVDAIKKANEEEKKKSKEEYSDYIRESVRDAKDIIEKAIEKEKKKKETEK